MRVVRRRYASGRISWVLDCGVVEGARVRRTFPTRAAAEAARVRLLADRARLGTAAAMLTEEERRWAAGILGRERIGGVPVREVVERAIREAEMEAGVRPREGEEWVTVQEAVERYVAAKAADGTRHRSVQQIRSVLRRFAAVYGGRPLREVEGEEVRLWLERPEWSAKTQDNARGELHALWAWAVREQLARTNPVQEVPRAQGRRREDEAEAEIFRAQECAALVQALARTDAELVPLLVLMLWAGLRPAEAQRVQWAEVHWTEGEVLVSGRTAKTRDRRVVVLAPCALAWLAPWAGRAAGPVRPVNVDRRLRAMRELAPRWPHDVLRHTYASMHLAVHRDAARLQAEMGHRSAEMLWRHYRAVVRREEALRFWALWPVGVWPPEVPFLTVGVHW